jgi:hypothetical protein
MVRQKVKGTFRKQPADASSEPNFYAMPPVQPEVESPSSADAAYGARYKATILPPDVSIGAAPQLLYGQQQIHQHHQEQEPTLSHLAPGGTLPMHHASVPSTLQHGRSPPAQSASATTMSSMAVHHDPSSLPTSPGLASVHGAAHLLQGIASGFKSSAAAFLGPAAASTPTTSSLDPRHQQQQQEGRQEHEQNMGDQNQQPPQHQHQQSPSRTRRASFLQPDKLEMDKKSGV